MKSEGEPAGTQGTADEGKTETKPEPKGSVATGKEDAPSAESSAPYWPEDWRDKAAEHVSAGKKDIRDKELRRLKTMPDPAALYGSYRNLEDMISSKDMVSIPGTDASEEDIKKFYSKLGVPASPDKYDVKLNDGLVVGENDQPHVDAFLKVAHKAGAPARVVNEALNWYFDTKEKQSYETEERDSDHHGEAIKELKEEYGTSFKRLTNGISTLFVQAPGGVDVTNGQGLFARLMGGRMADGTLVGDDPDMVRWLVSISSEINPAQTVVDGADGTPMESIDAELKKISTLRKTDRRAYNKDSALQQRERDLISAKEKVQARA